MVLDVIEKERRLIADVKPSDDGQKVSIAGWVYDLRVLGKICFVIIRDMSGDMQVASFKTDDEAMFKKISKVNRESVVFVSGKVAKNDKAPGGREIVPEKFEVISESESVLPIDVSDFSKTDLPKRLDYRFLDFHRKRTKAIFRIQSTISQAFQEHFLNEGFIEMQPPCVISAASEGGTDLFSVRYFENLAYLAQSPQLYKQMLACSMEKVFLAVPVWRAEKHNTVRHINEIRQLDIEAAFDGQMQTMKRLEKVVQFIVRKVLDVNREELELLGIKDLKIPKGKYLSYEETLEVLEKHGVEIDYGEDLSPEAEKKLDEIYPDRIVFVHSWPVALKPFYIMPKGEDSNAELSEGFDAIYKGTELSSGGQRIHIPDLLIQMIKKKGLNPDAFKEYIDSFRFGAPPHAGWSIGLERMTMMLCGLDNIREATMFPRDRDRLVP